MNWAKKKKNRAILGHNVRVSFADVQLYVLLNQKKLDIMKSTVKATSLCVLFSQYDPYY